MINNQSGKTCAKKHHIPAAYKFSFVLIIMFMVSCLKLCAEENQTSPEEAQILRNKFILEAKSHVGNPYVFGGVGPDSFDCSGLIYYCAREAAGIQLPRTAKAIYGYARIVPEEKREAGDLLFFKTTSSGTVSHVGIYIGNGQFISAISDGPNTGVIVSSLNQDYWKDKYLATGQFIASGRVEDKVTLESVGNAGIVTETASGDGDGNGGAKKPFKDNLFLDASVFCDWSLLSPRQFVFSFRGIDALFHCRYSGWENIQPGIGLGLRFNAGLQCFQLPLIVSLTVNDYIRAYAGPVFTFGKVTLIDTDKEINASVFPGTIGISFSTPNFDCKGVKLQAVQDISYSVYNNVDGAALSFVESVASGLVLFTGIRVTLPLEIL